MSIRFEAGKKRRLKTSGKPLQEEIADIKSNGKVREGVSRDIGRKPTNSKGDT
jgi:hypothetical protein